MQKTVLVTGGAGYIGSHACLALLEHGYEVVVLDNLCNSDAESLRRVAEICGKPAHFIEGDIRDATLLDAVFTDYSIDAVMHFAGLKAVGESVDQPLQYYDNNVTGSLRLLQAMDKAAVSRLVFSSSATVYGDPVTVPIRESAGMAPTNPYGWTKRMIEQILLDWADASDSRGVTLLRYFNPVGAHKSGRIGEAPQGRPNNLMPFITQVAVNQRDALQIFGSDYDTVDGTGVRDYIHVLDLVDGHVAALEFILADSGAHAVNLGTGHGVSVLQMLRAFEAVSDCTIPHKFVERRPGDIATCWADASLAHELFGWRATRTLEEMCEDSWRWQRENPNGYC